MGKAIVMELAGMVIPTLGAGKGIETGELTKN